MIVSARPNGRHQGVSASTTASAAVGGHDNRRVAPSSSSRRPGTTQGGGGGGLAPGLNLPAAPGSHPHPNFVSDEEDDFAGRDAFRYTVD
jgi:hypothetical protein